MLIHKTFSLFTISFKQSRLIANEVLPEDRSAIPELLSGMAQNVDGMNTEVVKEIQRMTNRVPVDFVEHVHKKAENESFSNHLEYIKFWVQITEFQELHPKLMADVTKYAVAGDLEISKIQKLTSVPVWVDIMSNNPNLLKDIAAVNVEDVTVNEIDNDEVPPKKISDPDYVAVVEFMKQFDKTTIRAVFMEFVDDYIPEQVRSRASVVETVKEPGGTINHITHHSFNSNFEFNFDSIGEVGDGTRERIKNAADAIHIILGEEEEDAAKDSSIARAIAQASLEEYIFAGGISRSGGDVDRFSRELQSDYQAALRMHRLKGFGVSTTSPDALRGLLQNSRLKGALNSNLQVMNDDLLAEFEEGISRIREEKSSGVSEVTDKMEDLTKQTENEIRGQMETLMDRFHDSHPLVKVAAMAFAGFMIFKHQKTAAWVGGLALADHFLLKGTAMKALFAGGKMATQEAQEAFGAMKKFNSGEGSGYNVISEILPFGQEPSAESGSELARRSEMYSDFTNEYDRDATAVEVTSLTLLNRVPLSMIAKSFSTDGLGENTTWKFEISRKSPAGMKLAQIAEEEEWGRGYLSFFNPPTEEVKAPSAKPKKGHHHVKHDECGTCAPTPAVPTPVPEVATVVVKGRDKISDMVSWGMYCVAVDSGQFPDQVEIVDKALADMPADMSPIDFFSGAFANKDAAAAYAKLVKHGEEKAEGMDITLGQFIRNYMQRFSTPEVVDQENGSIIEGEFEGSEVTLGAKFDGDTVTIGTDLNWAPTVAYINPESIKYPLEMSKARFASMDKNSIIKEWMAHMQSQITAGAKASVLGTEDFVITSFGNKKAEFTFGTFGSGSMSIDTLIMTSQEDLYSRILAWQFDGANSGVDPLE